MGRPRFNIPADLYGKLCTRAHQEGHTPDEVVTARIRQALREESLMPKSSTEEPDAEEAPSKVQEIGRSA